MLFNTEIVPSYENTQTFTKETLDVYLKELAKAYRKASGRHAEAEIVLIGGAAILAGYDFREMTTDVDAIIRADSTIKTAINTVGDNFGLPNGWLNTDFTKTSSYSPKLPQYSKFYKTFGGVLNVRFITGEYLIAMKLASFRPYKKDQSDILGVLLYHENIGKPISLKDVNQAITNLYGQFSPVSEEAMNFMQQAIASDNLPELFVAVSEAEKEAKDLLVSFEQDYTGVLNSDNLNEILSALQEKQSR